MKNSVKKSMLLFASLCFVMVLQNCKPKTDETTTTSIDSSAIISADVTKNEEAIARRERIQAARVEKEEQRRLAAIEKAKASPTYKDASGKTVYHKAEIDPSFVGGNDAMRDYLHDNLKYPEQALAKGIEGTVFVDFIVDEKGAVREVVATDVVGDDIDQTLKDEAVRVVSSMPAWIAGKQHGKAVDTNFSIPISFQLD